MCSVFCFGCNRKPFSLLQRYSWKMWVRDSGYSRWLRGYHVLAYVVVDYADTMCRRKRWLCGHVSRNTRTPTANFEGFSLILKEQSGEKSARVCLHTQWHYKIWKPPAWRKFVLKKPVVVVLTMLISYFCTSRWNIIAKTKIFSKLFYLFIFSPGRTFMQKRVEILVSLSL